MKMSSKLEKAFNEQITAEIFSAHQYLAMALYVDADGFRGSCNWLYKQYQEELDHANKMIKYLMDRGNKAVVPAIKAPETSYGKLVNVFEEVLKHEQYVTKKIHELYGIAMEEKDLSAQIFLNWFVSEQDEEEENAGNAVDMLTKAGDNMGAQMMIDQQLGSRAK